ncbi:hypothetical protein KXS11_12700 [Plantibacter flavus]|uniref:hypothetical protein n=1 Tax=Plantibacter flavus TaxID=150123 RepID=UPI003F18626C
MEAARMSSMNSLVWYHRAALARNSRGVWPLESSVQETDVLLGEESLLHLAEAEGTPMLRNAPGENGRVVSVLVTRIEAVIEALDFAGIDVWTDAEITGCRPLLRHARIIGRPAGPGTVQARMRPTAVTWSREECVELPSDVRQGDLVAIPCEGPTALYDVQRHSRHERIID